jgi:hypothetical protein
VNTTQVVQFHWCSAQTCVLRQNFPRKGKRFELVCRKISKQEEARRMPLKFNKSVKENVFQKLDILSLKDKVMDFTRVVLDRNEKFRCTELIFPSSTYKVEIRSRIAVNSFTM